MEIKKKGFFQALGVAAYCSVVGLFFWKGEDIFGGGPNYFIPVAMLLLFSTSVLVCALLVFYKPYTLFFNGKKKEAADLVLFTAGWLFLFLVFYLTLVLILR